GGCGFNDGSGPRRRLALTTLSLHVPSFPGLLVSRAHVAACRYRLPMPLEKRPTAPATRREWEGGDDSPNSTAPFAQSRSCSPCPGENDTLPADPSMKKTGTPSGEPFPEVSLRGDIPLAESSEEL